MSSVEYVKYLIVPGNRSLSSRSRAAVAHLIKGRTRNRTIFSSSAVAADFWWFEINLNAADPNKCFKYVTRPMSSTVAIAANDPSSRCNFKLTIETKILDLKVSERIDKDA